MKVALVRSPFAPDDQIMIAHSVDFEGERREDFTIIIPMGISDDTYAVIEKAVKAHNDFDGALELVSSLLATSPGLVPALVKKLGTTGGTA